MSTGKRQVLPSNQRAVTDVQITESVHVYWTRLCVRDCSDPSPTELIE